MIRELVGSRLVPPEKHFRWRGGEITRLEGFTDAVFAFAVTLLVVSLEVPKTYGELMAAMKGFVPFAFCFMVLVQIWRLHYFYSRRFGLQTPYAVALNSILLFVVLFYVYPLKFLFTLSMGFMSGGFLATDRGIFQISVPQVTTLEVIYGLGFTAVFTVFALLYRYAYRMRKELDLNEYELLRTRAAIVHCTGDAILGVCLAVAAKLLPLKIAVYSPLIFALSGPIHRVISSRFRKPEQRALENMAAIEKSSFADAGS
jgi:uncharacterized membrane protein